jgi:hypothetical protein
MDQSQVLRQVWCDFSEGALAAARDCDRGAGDVRDVNGADVQTRITAAGDSEND